MKIEQIKVADHTVSAVSGTHTATILMQTEDASLCLRASASPEQTNPNGITRALVQDAIRQLRRMPEYRTGAKVITIPDSAWPAPGKQA